MKTEIKQLLRDLKAATALGRPEAINVALDGLFAFPGVASNDRMNEGFVAQVVIPVGKTLATLQPSQVQFLLDHQLAVGRAIGAAALAHRFIQGKEATSQDLCKSAGDSRADVRMALGRTLFAVAEANPKKLLDLGMTWITQPAPKPRQVALIFLPALSTDYGANIVDLLGSLGDENDREVQAALVDALSFMAQAGWVEAVLGVLALWSLEPRPNSWVICRVLSTSWAADHYVAAEKILRDLVSKTGKSAEISSAVKALKRHGARIEI